MRAEAYEINFCLVGSEMCIRDRRFFSGDNDFLKFIIAETINHFTHTVKDNPFAVSYTHLTLPTTPYV